MRALAPTAIAFVGLVNVTAFSTSRIGAAGGVHVRPPSIVRSAVPSTPTATPVRESPNATEFSRSVAGAVAGNQFCPPSAVTRITPPTPTATPRFAVTNFTDRSPYEVFELCLYQPIGVGCGGIGVVGLDESSPQEDRVEASATSANIRSERPRFPASMTRCLPRFCLHRHAELAQRVVQAGLHVRARLALADDQRARHA